MIGTLGIADVRIVVVMADRTHAVGDKTDGLFDPIWYPIPALCAGAMLDASAMGALADDAVA